MSEPKIRFLSTRNLKHEDDGTPYFEKVTEFSHFEFIDRKWIVDKEKTTVEKFTPEQVGLFKSKTVLVAFPRENFNRETLKTVRGFFIQEIHVSVDSGKAFKNIWLNFVNGRLFKQYLDRGKYEGATCQISLTGAEDCINLRKGKAVRITEEKLKAMLKSGEISKNSVFEDENLSERIVYRARK